MMKGTMYNHYSISIALIVLLGALPTLTRSDGSKDENIITCTPTKAVEKIITRRRGMRANRRDEV